MILNINHKEEFNIPFRFKYLNDTDKTYHNLVKNILSNGVWKENRTGTKTISLFGPQVTFRDVGQRFPLVTTKKVHLTSIIGELLWFLSGSTDKSVLKNKYKTSIWDEWTGPKTDDPNEMGPIYGSQWVNWNNEGINQIQNVIDTLKTNPDDRRMIVSAWNPSKLDDMALPPCHWSFQIYSVLKPGNKKRTLHLIENQRSVDTFLGLPFNIASYAILLMMVAKEVDMIPGDLIMNLGDTHIYEDHIEFIEKQMNRESKSEEARLVINENKDFWDYAPEDFELLNYNPSPNFKNVPVAI